MRQLLKKDAKFQWTQVEFDMIKKLTSATVLQALDSIRTISYSPIPVYLEMALPCFNLRMKTPTRIESNWLWCSSTYSFTKVLDGLTTGNAGGLSCLTRALLQAQTGYCFFLTTFRWFI
jgi:hypothetical protein